MDPIRRENAILRANSLVVVNLPILQIKGKEPDKLVNQKWWHKLMNDRAVWVSETCSRILLVTTQEDWERLGSTMPDFTTRCMTQEMADNHIESDNPDPFTRAKPYFLKKEGWDAYTYLLEIVTGLHSASPGEEHISHQILDEEYSKYKDTKHGGARTWFEPIINALAHDSKQVRQVIGQYVLPSLEDTARELAQLEPGANVLLVNDNWQAAEKMIYALSRRNVKVKPSSIEVAHIAPQSNAVESLELQIQRMLEKQTTSFPRVGASALYDVLELTSMHDYQAVIIASTLGTHPKQEDQLIDAWRASNPPPPRLIAMHVDPIHEGGIMPHAELKETPGAFVLLPDDIREEYTVKMERHAKLLAQGKDACGLCTRLHVESNGHHKIRGDLLAFGYEGYLEKNPLEKRRSAIDPQRINETPRGGTELA